MPLFISLHREGALLESTPSSDSAIELVLDEKTMQTLAALEGLESYRIASALGAIWLHGARESHRSSRRRKPVSAG